MFLTFFSLWLFSFLCRLQSICFLVLLLFFEKCLCKKRKRNETKRKMNQRKRKDVRGRDRER